MVLPRTPLCGSLALALIFGFFASVNSGCGDGDAALSDVKVDRAPVLQFAGQPLLPNEPACASAIVLEAETGTILYEKNAHEMRAPASIVKMMVELVVLHEIEAGRAALTDSVRVTGRASKIGGSQVFLADGEVFPLGELLKAIAISSANDACVAVAEHLAGSPEGFVEMMNREAETMGLKDTHYANVHGLDDDPTAINLTTAADIARLGQALLRYPEVLEWSSTTKAPFRDGTFLLENTNKLLGDFNGLDGLKTGYTAKAGFCLCATAKRGDLRFVSVVMGCESNRDRFRLSADLLGRSFGNYLRMQMCARDEALGKVPVRGADSLGVVAAHDFALVVSRPDDRYLSTKLEVDPSLSGPIAIGAPVGKLVISCRDEQIGEVPVLAANAVGSPGLMTRLRRLIG